MVWPLALRSDDAKQDPVVYGTKFGAVFLAEGPRTASIQEGLVPYEFHHYSLIPVFKRKIRPHLDLLSLPRL